MIAKAQPKGTFSYPSYLCLPFQNAPYILLYPLSYLLTPKKYFFLLLPILLCPSPKVTGSYTLSVPQRGKEGDAYPFAEGDALSPLFTCTPEGG